MGPIGFLVSGLMVLAVDQHETHTHAAHVHGVGHLAIAIDSDGQLQAELVAPGDSVFGFEHAPQTADDRATVEQARARLLDGDATLWFNREAGCVLQSADMDGDEDSYRDVKVTYRFACSRPARLERVETGIFDGFERFEEIETVFLSPSGQEGFELTPTATGYRFRR